MGEQTVYDLAEKRASSLDLIEKNMVGSDLVYELTETDSLPKPLSAKGLGPTRRHPHKGSQSSSECRVRRERGRFVR